MPTFTSKQPDPAPPSTPPTADQKTRKPKGHIGEPSPYRDQVGTVQQEGEATHCSFSGPIKLEAARWLESKVQEVQCSTCGSVSKAKLKGQSVVIVPHPPRKARPVLNVTRWMEQESDWLRLPLAQEGILICFSPLFKGRCATRRRLLKESTKGGSGCSLRSKTSPFFLTFIVSPPVY